MTIWHTDAPLSYKSVPWVTFCTCSIVTTGLAVSNRDRVTIDDTKAQCVRGVGRLTGTAYIRSNTSYAMEI